MTRNKSRRLKSIKEREIKIQRQQPSYESFVEQKLPAKPDKEKKAKDCPVVFVRNASRRITDEERAQKRRERNRTRNLKRRECIKALKCIEAKGAKGSQWNLLVKGRTPRRSG